MTASRSQPGRDWTRTALSSLPTAVRDTISLQVRSLRFLTDLPSLAALYVAAGVLASVAPAYLSAIELTVGQFLLACPVLAITYLAVADWTGADPQTPISFLQGIVVGSGVVAVPLSAITATALGLVALLGGNVAGLVPGVPTTGVLELYLAPLYPLVLYLLVSSTLVVPAAVIDRARPTVAGRLGWRAVRSVRWTVVGLALGTALVAGAVLGAVVAAFTALTWLAPGGTPTLDYVYARHVVYEVCKWLFAVALGLLYVDERPVAEGGPGRIRHPDR